MKLHQSLVGSFLYFASFIALSHHSAATHYLVNETVEAEGEIVRVFWRNPHVRFTLRGMDETGAIVEWEVESIPVSRLARMGIDSEIMGVGQTVRVAGYPSKSGATQIYALNLLLPDGREMLLDSSTPRWANETIGTGVDEPPGELLGGASPAPSGQ